MDRIDFSAAYHRKAGAGINRRRFPPCSPPTNSPSGRRRQRIRSADCQCAKSLIARRSPCSRPRVIFAPPPATGRRSPAPGFCDVFYCPSARPVFPGAAEAVRSSHTDASAPGYNTRAIAEVEQLLSAFPIPDHRVEGREHGAMAGGQLTAGRGLQLRQRLVMQPHLAECFHVNRHHQPLFLPAASRPGSAGWRKR